MSLADKVSFKNLCQLFTKIKNEPKNKKIDTLKRYIYDWKKKGEEWKTKISHLNDSFFPVLRLLLPQLDKERGAYGVKEVALAKIYIRILSLPKDGRDAIKLLDFRAPQASNFESCDFAEVVYWILKSRCSEGGKLSIDDINKHLDKIAYSHALNDGKSVDLVLVSLLTNTCAEEQKWLIRILLKNVKLNMSQNSIFNCYHLDAKDLYEATYNLKKVCDTLKNSAIRLNEIEVEIFSPFRPMLCEECDIQKINMCLSKSSYFHVETKLDGERFQLHMKNGHFKYFSRNGHDYSSNFGRTCHEGNLTPRIAHKFLTDVKSCILDGEMMIWNSETQTLGTKGSNVDVKSLRESGVYQPCFCVFDILFLNDVVLTNRPLSARLEILKGVFDEDDGNIQLLRRKKVSIADEVFEALNEAIDNCEEGIVLKEFKSVYRPNIRKNGGWYKIKPEYINGLSDTLDLVIIGGYFGAGRHKGYISHFLLGVLVNSNKLKNLFYSTAKVGSGYSINELNNLLSKMQPYWKKTEPGKMPANIIWAKEKPDVWIEPSESFVLEIKAAEIISSNLFKSGYSLRFPRVEKIRYDKSWENCLTLEELMSKTKLAAGKLATSHFRLSDTFEFVPKKRKRSLFRIQNKVETTSNIQKISNLLQGKEICVLSGFDHIDSQEVERKIIEFGGSIVKNPGKNTFCILAENNKTARIKNLMHCGFYDIIITSWFYGQLQTENKKLPDFKPEHFVAFSERRKYLFSQMYDEFGDHYTSQSSKEAIAFPMKLAGAKVNHFNFTSDDLYNFDIELFGGASSPYGIFRYCWSYFDQFAEISNNMSQYLPGLETYKIDYLFRSGKCLNVISDQITHVIVHSKNLRRLNGIYEINSIRKKKFHVVTEKWITNSIKEGNLSKATGLECQNYCQQ